MFASMLLSLLWGCPETIYLTSSWPGCQKRQALGLVGVSSSPNLCPFPAPGHAPQPG